MQVKFKKLHPDAITPTKATDGSAGFDLYVTAYAIDEKNNNKETYFTDISIEIPKGYVGLLCPRSSLCKGRPGRFPRMINSIGVIDSDYRGELRMVFENKGKMLYDKGDRCGQLVIVPCPEIELIESDELSTTERGTGGFGSTGI